jgi:hypothetical protein
MAKEWWDQPSVAELRTVAQDFVTLIDERDALSTADGLKIVTSIIRR